MLIDMIERSIKKYISKLGGSLMDIYYDKNILLYRTSSNRVAILSLSEVYSQITES